VGKLVAAVARRRAVALPVALVVTAACGYYATGVEPRFDVRDFFDERTDFVAGLEAFDRHVGDRGGEPAQVYVESDLTRSHVLASLRGFVDQVQRLGTEHLARDDEGRVLMDPGVLGLIDEAGLRGSAPEELGSFYRRARQQGIVGPSGAPIRPALRVRSVLWLPEGEGPGATLLEARIPGSRSLEAVTRARAALEPLVADLDRQLATRALGSRAVLTGPAIARLVTLEAVVRALRLSIPVAALLCFLVALAFMRSARLALVCVLPLIFVVACLYAFMRLAGFGVNAVTATIGAISIGVGIDFAVHLTMRYREELAKHPTKLDALEAAGAGTGSALVASALSSVVGFAILAFAPMPMFAAYGLLTVVMILLALAASLLVLPPLLVTASRRADGRAS
jgi:predicted RND superfamily exporter protein